MGDGLFINANVDQKTASNVSIVAGTIQVLCATEAEKHPAFVVKFIALSVTTEIVVVIKNKDAGVLTLFFQVIPGCCKPAHAATDDDQVVMLVQWCVFLGFLSLPGERMSNFKRTGMTASHTRENRGIVTGERVDANVRPGGRL